MSSVRLVLLLSIIFPMPSTAGFAKARGGRKSYKIAAANGFGAKPAKPETAKSAAAAAARPSANPSLSAQHNSAMALLEAGDFEKAGLAFESVINANPDAADSWSALGVCMAELGEPDAALSCQKQVLRIRGASLAGGETAYREHQFSKLAATSDLPPLPNGRRLTLATGTLDACETGGRVWSSAVVLCRWLQGEHEAGRLGGASVLELGCGTGAVGLYAACLRARVLLTDGGPSALLDLARANAASNEDLWSSGSVEVVGYRWGEPAGALGSFDLVLGSDVTFAAGGHDALCCSIAEQLREHSRSCRVVLAHEHRIAEMPTPACDGVQTVTWGGDTTAVGGCDGDEKLLRFVAAAGKQGLEVVTMRTEVEDGRSVSLLQVLHRQL